MAAKKTAPAAPSHTVYQNVVKIPLRDIHVDYEWNSRSGDWTQDEGDDESSNFNSLMMSIEQNGQDTPVTVKPHGKNKYFLVEGFRRFTAISKIAEKTGEKGATIDAVIKNLTESQAAELNVRENSAREDLKGPDLAWGLYRIYVTRTKENGGQAPTDSALALSMGKTQQYVSRLMRIMKQTNPEVTKAWRDSTIQLSITEMEEIAKLNDHALQLKAYKEKIGTKDPEGKKATGRGEWVNAAKRKAAEIGHLLGTLEVNDLVDTAGLEFDNFDAMKVWLPKLNKDATVPQKRAIAKAAQEAYDKAKTAQASEESDAANAE